MTCGKSGSTNFNHPIGNGINTQISFKTTTAPPWFEIHHFPEVGGCTKSLPKYQYACCAQLAVLHEPVGRKWKAVELLYQLAKLINARGKSRGFLDVQIHLVPLHHYSSQWLG